MGPVREVEGTGVRRRVLLQHESDGGAQEALVPQEAGRGDALTLQLEREPFPSLKLGWNTPERVRFRLVRLASQSLEELAADLPAAPGAAPAAQGNRLVAGLRRIFGRVS